MIFRIPPICYENVKYKYIEKCISFFFGFHIYCLEYDVLSNMSMTRRNTSCPTTVVMVTRVTPLKVETIFRCVGRIAAYNPRTNDTRRTKTRSPPRPPYLRRSLRAGAPERGRADREHPEQTARPHGGQAAEFRDWPVQREPRGAVVHVRLELALQGREQQGDAGGLHHRLH